MGWEPKNWTIAVCCWVVAAQPIGTVVDPDPLTLFRNTYLKIEVGIFMRSVSNKAIVEGNKQLLIMERLIAGHARPSVMRAPLRYSTTNVLQCR